MRKIFQVMLMGLIVFGTVPIQTQSAPQKPEDCVICGHACCCPEMCAPKIKELKRKQAQGCDQSVSICNLKPAAPVAVILLHEHAMLKKPVSWLAGAIPPNLQDRDRLPQVSSILSDYPPIQEVLTPPPVAPAA